MENTNMQYVRLFNFSEDANMLVNRAIHFSNKEKCNELNAIHLFLAILEKTEAGHDILKKLHVSFESVYAAYAELAAEGLFGELSGSLDVYNLETMTKDLFLILGTATAKTSIKRAEVTPGELLVDLLETESKQLDNFLDYIGTSRSAILDIKNQRFEIPDALVDYVVNMNAEKGKNSEIIGNTDYYVDKMIEVLSRKLEANPCLVGEAGVGKTTLARALVQRIINGNVPKEFINTNVIYINSSLLASGTRFRGDFEERMKCLIDWASKSDVILFLDELHTFVDLGANGNSSSDTAGNMIKKVLSDGDIKIIGATTTKEYHKFIEKDSAFDRRLQVIDVKEPSVETTIKMVEATKSNYESFHNVKIPSDCVKVAVELSGRYIKNKAFPAKAYKVIDQAATVAKLSGRTETSEDDILQTISSITGINVNKITKSEAKQLLNLEGIIGERLIGQENAVKTVSKAIRRAKAGVREEGKPLASFLFVGPTGVGKTELCKVLSDEVALGDTKLIKVDMSEFSEKYSTSKLIGTAPGYVGYGEGGQLTEKVKHNPYSLVLFDEIEKAHPDVFNAFLQLLDEGRMTDGEGNTVDFTNCIIVMTSNAGYGAEKLGKSKLGFNADSYDTDDSEKIALEALKDTFKPEFLNRLDNIVIFEKLEKEQCKDIVKLMLDKLSERVYKNNGITLKFGKSVVDYITDCGFSTEYGARNIRREIQNKLEDVISDAILSETLKNGDTATVSVRNSKVKITVKGDK